MCSRARCRRHPRHPARRVFSSTGLGVFSGYGFADGITGMAGQFYVQLVGVLATVAFTAVITFVIPQGRGPAMLGLRVQ